MRRISTLCCLLIAIPVSSVLGAQNDAGLAAVADEIREQTRSPAVGIMKTEGGTLRIGVSGTRRKNGDDAVTPDDLWHIGSNTKSITATLVARLVEQGIVAWNDTVGQLLGDAIAEIDPELREMTFLHLLSHRSGLRANIGRSEMIAFASQDALTNPLPGQRIEYARSVLGSSPAVAPELRFLYSNAGYVVAGAMLEQVTGKSWEELITREVFEPLGMRSAGFGPPGEAGETDQPLGHRRRLFGLLSSVEPGPGADNPPVLGPAGTVHLSLEDLSKYLAVHLAGARGEQTEFLSAESWALLHTPPFGGNYALGWGIEDGAIMHAGSNTMWMMQVVFVPESNTAVAIAFNEGRLARLQPVIGRAMETLTTTD